MVVVAHVPIPSAQGPADDPEIVSTGPPGRVRSWEQRGDKQEVARTESQRRLGGPTSEELVDQR